MYRVLINILLLCALTAGYLLFGQDSSQDDSGASPAPAVQAPASNKKFNF